MAVPVSMASGDLKGNRVSVKLQTFLLSDVTSWTQCALHEQDCSVWKAGMWEFTTFV